MTDVPKHITIDDFLKCDLRVGTVTSCEIVAESEKLIKETVDFGDFGVKTVFSGIRKWYKPANLIGKQLIFIVNLPPRKMPGGFSEAMVLAADDEVGKPILLSPRKKLPNGAKIR